MSRPQTAPAARRRQLEDEPRCRPRRRDVCRALRRGLAAPPEADARVVALPVLPADPGGRPRARRTARSRSAARTSTRRTRAPSPATSPARSWPTPAAPGCSAATASAGAYHGESDELVARKVDAALRHRLTPDDLRRRDPRRAPARGGPSRCWSASSRAGARRLRPAAVRPRLRAGLGDRHRRDGDPGDRPGGPPVPARPLAELLGETAAEACRSSTAARSRRTTRPRSDRPAGHRRLPGRRREP